MTSRTPSFVLVGLVMVTFLIGFFYMSCSSKTTELRQTLDQFEERIRSLTIKNSDKEREIETLNTKKREVEDEKLSIQKQLEKKDSEFRDLNTKLNEKRAELRSLRSDKQVLDEQLKEFKIKSDTLASKNSAIEKLQQEYDEQKKFNSEQLTRLKQDIENYKNQLNNPDKSFQISNQRFQRLLPSGETIKNTSAFFQESLDKLSNITNKIKDKIVPVISDIKEKISNAIDIGNHSILNQSNNTQQTGRNKPAREPLDLGTADDRDNQERNHSEIHRHYDTLSENKSLKISNDTGNGDKQRPDINDAQKIINRPSGALLNEINIPNNQSDMEQSQLSANDKNYRIANRKKSHQNVNKNEAAHHNRVIANNNDDQKQEIQNGNLL